jgi:hypothetical protein
MKTGWISLHRKVKDNWLWKDKPFSFGQAWITVLLECNHAEKKVNLGNYLYHVKRGESINSLDTWAKLFGWNKSKVRRFFDLLKSDSMIDTKPTHNTTHLTVINYSSYQDVEHKVDTKLTQSWHEVDTKLAPNNNDNNGNNENKVYRNIQHLTLLVSEFDKLRLKYSKVQIDSILDDMENWAKLKTKKSAYLTANKWLGNIKDSAGPDLPRIKR